MDLNKTPKQFCENVNIGATPEYFVLGFLSGDDAKTYVFTPGHAKRLAQSLLYNIGEYEKRFGEISADQGVKNDEDVRNQQMKDANKLGVQSPIQMLDIKNGGDKKKGKK